MNERAIARTLAEVFDGFDEQPERVQKQLLDLAADVENIDKQVLRLNLGPASVERRLERYRQTAKTIREYGRQQAGIFADLEDVGLFIDRLSDLRKPGVGNARAVPILLKWLPSLPPNLVHFQVIPALGQPWAKPDAIQPLFDVFHTLTPVTDLDPNSLRWFIAQSLLDLVDDSWFDQVLAIATDPDAGDSRDPFIRALGKMRKHRDELVPVMLDFLRNDSSFLYLPAAKVLVHWKITEARPIVQHLLDTVDTRPLQPGADPQYPPWERSELKKILKRFPRPAQEEA